MNPLILAHNNALISENQFVQNYLEANQTRSDQVFQQETMEETFRSLYQTIENLRTVVDSDMENENRALRVVINELVSQLNYLRNSISQFITSSIIPTEILEGIAYQEMIDNVNRDELRNMRLLH